MDNNDNWPKGPTMDSDNNWPKGPAEANYFEGEKIHQPPFLKRHFWKIVALGSLVLVVIFGALNIALLTAHSQPSPSVKKTIPLQSTFPSTTQPPTDFQITPTASQMTTTVAADATLTPSPASVTPTTALSSGLPCNVNMVTWSNGSADWKVLNKVVLNDGTNGSATRNIGPTLVAPCQINTTANYAVESKIQVISSQSYASFGITVRGNPASDGWQGYRAGVGDNDYNFGNVHLTGPDYSDTTLSKSTPFNPGTNAHLYRVEAKDNIIKLLIDGNLILTMTDNRYLTGTEIGLWSNNVQLQVTSFKVVAIG